MAIVSRPMGPVPKTAAVSPSGRARGQRMQSDGERLEQSAHVPIESSGSGTRLCAGMFTNSRKKPGSGGVLKNTDVRAAVDGWPDRQNSQ